MKSVLFLIALNLMLSIFGQQNDLTKSNLNGNVQSVRTIRYRAIQKKKKVKLGSVQSMVNLLVYYNMNGNDSILSHYRFIKGYHVLSNNTTYDYLGSHKNYHTSTYSNGEQYGYGKYKYDIDSNLIVIDFYNADDSIIQTRNYSYLENGQVEVQEVSTQDTSTYAIHIYDKQGSRIKSTYYRKGELTYSRTFNTNDDRIETSWDYTSQGIKTTYFCTYEFDKQNNWTKKQKS